MFGKRGQQLGIAIVGVVIFLGLIGILYEVDKMLKTRETIDDAPLQAHVQRCLEESMGAAIANVGNRGGYHTLPPRTVEFRDTDIPMYLSIPDGVWTIPTAEVVAMAIAGEAEELLPSCVAEFAGSYDEGTPQLQVQLTGEVVTGELEYPLTLTKGDEVKTLTPWSAAVPSALPALRTAAEVYTAAQQEKSVIRLAPLVDAARTADAHVTLVDLGRGVVAYRITAGDAALQFAIAYGAGSSFGSIATLLPEQLAALGVPVTAEGTLRYSDLGGLLEVQEKLGNNPPVIPSYPTQRVVVGRTLLFPLKVTDPDGDKLTYEVLTPLPGLEITASGKLQWGPTNYQDTTIEFRVSDGKDSREGSIRIIADYRPRVDWEKLSYP